MSQGLLLAGDLYLDRLDDNGVPTGFLDKINAIKLAITHPDPDKKDRISKQKASLGQALDSVLLPKPTEIEFETDDAGAEILAMAMLASQSAISVTGTGVTDEAVTLIKNRWVRLAHRNVAASGFSVATAAVPGTPLTEGTDYQRDNVNGMVMALNDTTAVACLVDYTYGNLTGTKLVGGGRTTINAKLLLDGVNKVNSNRCELTVDKASLAPSSPIDWFSGEYVVTALKGTLIDIGNGPYVYEETDAA